MIAAIYALTRTLPNWAKRSTGRALCCASLTLSAILVLLVASGCAKAGRVLQGVAVAAGGTSPADEGEITLLGSDGAAVAYITQDLAIYLWDGTPAAYLHPDASIGFHVYTFNGQHLGWYSRGVFRDRTGRAVGVTKELFGGMPHLEPLKGIKPLAPLKGLRALPPVPPLFGNGWSQVYLDDLLRQ